MCLFGTDRDASYAEVTLSWEQAAEEGQPKLVILRNGHVVF